MVVNRKVKRLILWVSDVKFNDRGNPKRNLQLGRTLLFARKRHRKASRLFERAAAKFLLGEIFREAAPRDSRKFFFSFLDADPAPIVN